MVACTAIVGRGIAAEGDLRVDYPWTTLRAEGETEVTCVLPQEFLRADGISWRLTSENNRTLASGETAPVAAADGPTVSITMRTPPVRDGVMLQTTLQVSGPASPAGGPALSRTFWILAADPFAAAPEQWKKRNVRIYDPEESLVPHLETLSLQHEVIDNPDALEELRDGILVIGEGVSFREMPVLWEVLNRLAAGGVPVLCLSPADGSVELPGAAGTSLPLPSRVTWKRADVASAVRPGLAWPSVVDGRPSVRQFSLRGEGESVLIDMAADGAGWPWLEIDYGVPHGTMILCGLSFGEYWEASPTPAWLFASMMESLVTNKPALSGESK